MVWGAALRPLRLDLPLRASRTSLDIRRPVNIHGYFTALGHIIVIRGYNVSGFLYGLIARPCSPESQQDHQNLWIDSLFRV